MRNQLCIARASRARALQSPLANDGVSAINSQSPTGMTGSLPRHIAFIIDGNGRWAVRQGLERQLGHNTGANVTVDVTKRAFAIGVECVTLYLFSTENWSRPSSEIENIWMLLERYLMEVSEYLQENGIRLCIIGQFHRLPMSCQLLIQKLSVSVSSPTAATKKTLCLALSYGGRDDIVQACREIASKGLRADQIDESMLSASTATGKLGIPDPDLIIRTSGALRLSNFLLWQSAYSEFESVDKLWPDFTADEAENVIRSYAKRERRFGK